MRPWMIVSLSTTGAVLVAAAMAVPEVANVSRTEIWPTLVPSIPAIAVGALGSYGLCAMVLTTITLVAGILRVRQLMGRAAPGADAEHGGARAASSANEFDRLVPNTSPMHANAERSLRSGLSQPRFTARETRSEIGRIHYVSLARSHFISALIVLAGIIGLGMAQDRGALPLHIGPIPTASAILILAGLLLLAALGRVAIDVTAEPLLETISQLPAARAEVGLLRRVVELLEAGHNSPAVDDRARGASTQLPERLVAAIDEGHRTLLDAIQRLSANTQALEAGMQGTLEALETTMQAIVAQQRSSADGKVVEAAGFAELQVAVEELTALLRRLSAATEVAGGTDTASAPAQALPGTHPTGIARELRRLLQEIDTAR
jgi:hypothetical protein